MPGAKEQALQVIAQWGKAFTESDVDGIVALHAPDAIFLGTGSKSVVTETAGIRAYFEKGLLSNRPRHAKLVSYEAQVLSEDTVLVAGFDAISGVRDGEAYTNTGRATFVVARRGSDWKIVHFHRSALPK